MDYVANKMIVMYVAMKCTNLRPPDFAQPLFMVLVCCLRHFQQLFAVWQLGCFNLLRVDNTFFLGSAVFVRSLDLMMWWF